MCVPRSRSRSRSDLLLLLEAIELTIPLARLQYAAIRDVCMFKMVTPKGPVAPAPENAGKKEETIGITNGEGKKPDEGR